MYLTLIVSILDSSSVVNYPQSGTYFCWFHLFMEVLVKSMKIFILHLLCIVWDLMYNQAYSWKKTSNSNFIIFCTWCWFLFLFLAKLIARHQHWSEHHQFHFGQQGEIFLSQFCPELKFENVWIWLLILITSTNVQPYTRWSPGFCNSCCLACNRISWQVFVDEKYSELDLHETQFDVFKPHTHLES